MGEVRKNRDRVVADLRAVYRRLEAMLVSRPGNIPPFVAVEPALAQVEEAVNAMRDVVALADELGINGVEMPSGRWYRVRDGVLEHEFDTGWHECDNVEVEDIPGVAKLMADHGMGETDG